MFLITGIVPHEDFPLILGKTELKNEALKIDTLEIPVERGTSALISASIKVLEYFNKPLPFVFLVGDIGKGNGSKNLYKSLAEVIPKLDPKLITFHYILPDVDGCLKVIMSLEKLNSKPFLIADAGFMYVVKMAGYANFFDLFTPDIGELAFLADEEAPHPFYTRGFLLAEENKIEDLIKRAYQYKNTPQYLLVKGEKDYIVKNGKILEIILDPIIPELEAIGGTGDTLTGIVSALIYIGFSPEKACSLGSKINRLAGALANPTPATQIFEIIKYITPAL
ncbi:MAG: sugar kinase, partial [Thermodesulfobacterium geofontis]